MRGTGFVLNLDSVDDKIIRYNLLENYINMV